MKFLRRLANIVATVILIALVIEMILLATNGRMPEDEKAKMIGGAVFVAAIIFGGVFFRFRRKEVLPLGMIDDPNAIIQIDLPPSEAKAFTAMFLFAAIGCGVMILGGLDGGDQVWPWVGLLLFGGLSMLSLFRRPTVSLRLSPEGIDHTGFKTGPIAWRDIQSATIKTMGRISYISLDLRNPQEYLARRPRSFRHLLERLPLSKPFVFTPPSAGVSPESIVRAIEVRLSAFGRSGAGRVTSE